MILDVGNKVVYPYQGPCRIGAVVDKIVGGTAASFYQLAVLDDSGDELFVPVDKVRVLGVRQLITKSDIPKLLSQLRQESETTKVPSTAMNWKQRIIDNTKLLASGSAFDLAKIIKSLTVLNETRALSPRDRQVLDKARRNLICEISEVIGKTKLAVEEQVDRALQMGKAGLRSDNDRS